MDAAKKVEGAGIAAVEIDRNHGKAGSLDEFYYVFGPGLVFDDPPFPDGGALFSLLPGGDFSGREESKGMPLRNMS